MFSVRQNGIELDKSKYEWDEKNLSFFSKEDNLVLDFNCDGVRFYTGNHCTFKTGTDCIFHTGSYCIFKTKHSCNFYTGKSCNFHTGYYSTFKTGENCFVTRYDVEGVMEIPVNKTIKLNSDKVRGYVFIETKETTLNGKIVVIDGKYYKVIKEDTLNGKIVAEKIKETALNGKIVIIDNKEYTLQLKNNNNHTLNNRILIK